MNGDPCSLPGLELGVWGPHSPPQSSRNEPGSGRQGGQPQLGPGRSLRNRFERFFLFWGVEWLGAGSAGRGQTLVSPLSLRGAEPAGLPLLQGGPGSPLVDALPGRSGHLVLASGSLHPVWTIPPRLDQLGAGGGAREDPRGIPAPCVPAGKLPRPWIRQAESAALCGHLSLQGLQVCRRGSAPATAKCRLLAPHRGLSSVP